MQVKRLIENSPGILLTLYHWEHHDTISREKEVNLEGKVACLALNMLSVRYLPELLSKIPIWRVLPGLGMQVSTGDKDNLRQGFSDGIYALRVHGKRPGDA